MTAGRQTEPVLPQHVEAPQNIEGRENKDIPKLKGKFAGNEIITALSEWRIVSPAVKATAEFLGSWISAV